MAMPRLCLACRGRPAACAGALCAVSTADGIGDAGLARQQGLDRAAHRLHRRGVRPVGQQRHLHQAAAQLDALDQAGGDDVLAGGGIGDRAQRLAQARRRVGAVVICLQTFCRRPISGPP